MYGIRKKYCYLVWEVKSSHTSFLLLLNLLMCYDLKLLT